VVVTGTNTPTWSIVSNRAVLTNLSATTSFIAVDAGASDGTYTATLASAGTSHAGGLGIRISDFNNLLFLTTRVSSGNNLYSLQRKVAGTTTVLQTASSVDSADGDVIQVILAGLNIRVKVNGVEIINQTVADFSTLTKFGLYGSSGNYDVQWDDVSFMAA
jgi:hypothetical protein